RRAPFRTGYRERAVLRHATHRRLVVADPPPRGGRPPDPLPRAGSRGGLHRAGTPVPMTTPAPDRLAELVATYAGDAKAIDPVELDLRDVLAYTDYFVICTGNT